MNPEALKLARKLSVLPEPAMRERVFCEYIERVDPMEAVKVMSHIYSIGREGGPPFDIALLTISNVLSHNLLGYETQAGLYNEAKKMQLTGLSRLFFASPSGSKDRRLHNETREQTLGHRKWYARSPDRNLLERLLRNPEPQVVRNLLLNPRITEQDVVLLAARRPTDPEVQLEIFNSRKWIARYSVKRALVLNPNTPSDLGLRLLGFMTRRDLRLIQSSPTIAASIRSAAEELLKDRRPL